MTKDVEREAFEALPLAKLALDQDWVRYSEDTNTYYPNEDFCPESAPETMNFAWQSWQAAKAHEAKKLEGCVVAPVEMPDSFNDATTDYFNDTSEGENYDAFVKLVDIDNKSIWAMAVEAARGGNE